MTAEPSPAAKVESDELLKALRELSAEFAADEWDYGPVVDDAIDLIEALLKRESAALAASPPKIEGRDVEALAQFLHDEGGFGDAWPDRSWPDHPEDTGQREGGYLKLVPPDVQAKFRDVARRWLAASPPKIEQDAVERVNPLVWRVPDEDELGHDGILLTALGVGGTYDIGSSLKGTFILWWAADPFTFREGFQSIDEAKAAAQEDWKRAIHAAIAKEGDA